MRKKIPQYSKITGIAIRGLSANPIARGLIAFANARVPDPRICADKKISKNTKNVFRKFAIPMGWIFKCIFQHVTHCSI